MLCTAVCLHQRGIWGVWCAIGKRVSSSQDDKDTLALAQTSTIDSLDPPISLWHSPFSTSCRARKCFPLWCGIQPQRGFVRIHQWDLFWRGLLLLLGQAMDPEMEKQILLSSATGIIWRQGSPHLLKLPYSWAVVSDRFEIKSHTLWFALWSNLLPIAGRWAGWKPLYWSTSFTRLTRRATFVRACQLRVREMEKLFSQINVGIVVLWILNTLTNIVIAVNVDSSQKISAFVNWNGQWTICLWVGGSWLVHSFGETTPHTPKIQNHGG